MVKPEISGIVLTMSPPEWHKTKPFEILLRLYSIFILWYKFRSIPIIKRKLAARVMHVRLCVKQLAPTLWRFFSQSSPIAKFDDWDEAFLKSSQRFIYCRPTFSDRLTPTITERLYTAANDKINNKHSRGYDYLQLLSVVLNTFIWIFGDCIGQNWWWEEKIRIFNIPGGHETCSSAIDSLLNVFGPIGYWFLSDVLNKHDTAMVPPFAFGITKDFEYGFLQ